MDKDLRCCVIVVTFNGAKWIEKCLNSIESTYDIIIVDNNSTDNTLELLSDYTRVHLISNKQNLGFGKANNLALAYAFNLGYDFFFLLNQDAWVEKDVIGQLIRHQFRNDQYGVLSPIHLEGKGINLDAGFSRYMRLRKSSGFYGDFKAGRIENKIYEVSFVNAAAWLITRNCLKQVGLFHPLFDHYGEDDNYIHRVHYAGLKVGILGGQHIYHDRSQRFKKRINPKAKFRSMVLMVHLNPLKSRTYFAKWLISMGNMLTIPAFKGGIPDFSFYLWAVSKYTNFVDEIGKYGNRFFNPLR